MADGEKREKPKLSLENRPDPRSRCEEAVGEARGGPACGRVQKAVRKCRAGEKARWVRRAGPAEDTRGEGERDCAQGGQRVRPPLGDRGLRQKGNRQGGWEGL